MKVLVTGHKGYIGGVLVPILHHAGHDVVGCDVNYFADCLFLPELIEVENLAKDIRDLESCDLESFDAVIHLAGLPNESLGGFNAASLVEINQLESVSLSEMAKAAGVKRFLSASSYTKYGASNEELLEQSAPSKSQPSYGVSKDNPEAAICEMADDQFASCNLRTGMVYGVAPRMRFDLMVNRLCGYAISRGEIRLKSDGTAWRPMVHVEDVAQAFHVSLEAEADLIAGESFNVCDTQENYRIIDVADLIAQIIPDARLSFTETACIDVRNDPVNCGTLTNTLELYEPRWRLADGIQQLSSTLRRKSISEIELEGSQYLRLAHMRLLIERGDIDNKLRFVSTRKQL
ncbi:MAG: NAD(P)-dependent oxidoreductase [Pseudomonadota bacterium]